MKAGFATNKHHAADLKSRKGYWSNVAAIDCFVHDETDENKQSQVFMGIQAHIEAWQHDVCTAFSFASAACLP